MCGAFWIGFLCLSCGCDSLQATEPELIARWPLGAAEEPAITYSSPLMVRDLTEIPGPFGGPARQFNGRSSMIELTSASSTQLGRDDFTIALWVNSAAQGHESPGDLISQYDPVTRTGFHLGLYSHGGVTNAQPNLRQLHFGIDQGKIETDFTDHGRLGNAVYVFSLCVHDGRLYASTCEPDATQAGHVYRFDGQDRWTDLGSPDKANAISAMTSFNGHLVVASSKYRLGGSSLQESTNANFGGKVFALAKEGNDPHPRWLDWGTLSPETEAVASLINFRGRLYASSLYRPAGFFRYEGGQTWTALETPAGKRVEATTVFNDALYGGCYDEGSVFRFDGNRWEELGSLPGATQTYGFGIHRGQLHVSEWPQAHVFRWDESAGRQWSDTGRLGMELEAMPLLVYNGKMYCGSLPNAEVYRYDAQTIADADAQLPNAWTKIGQVDHTENVKYRRAWSMAIYQGRLFVGCLPSGRVLSIEAGKNVTLDRAFPDGWHHVVAMRQADRLKLFVDGECVAESSPLDFDYDLSTQQPLRIGFGAQDYYEGAMYDVRIYRGALPQQQIKQLAQRR